MIRVVTGAGSRDADAGLQRPHRDVAIRSVASPARHVPDHVLVAQLFGDGIVDEEKMPFSWLAPQDDNEH